eukprot:2275207-Karenia_brevis.AAC.1
MSAAAHHCSDDVDDDDDGNNHHDTYFGSSATAPVELACPCFVLVSMAAADSLWWTCLSLPETIEQKTVYELLTGVEFAANGYVTSGCKMYTSLDNTLVIWYNGKPVTWPCGTEVPEGC